MARRDPGRIVALAALCLGCGGRAELEPGSDGAAPGAADGASPGAGADAAGVDAAGTGPLWDPAAPGPWAVGVRTLELTDASRARTLPVDVWYPVDPAAPDGEPNVYELTLVGFPLAGLASPARRGGTPADAGPLPLVLFSHGFGGIRFQSYFLTEHLASHGFVVAAPDHPGNTLLDFASLGDDAATAQSAVDRPLDVLFVLDRLAAGVTGLAVTVDPGRVSVTGHSFGAWTALEVARRDPRARAVFPMAPGFKQGATPDFVATLDRPVFIFGGSEDGTTPFDPDQQVPYDIAQPPKHLLKVVGAGHLDFSNLCEVPIATLLVDDGCNPDVIDPAEVHARARTLAAAFALRYANGDARYDAFLDPAYVLGLGRVDYWRAP